MTATSLTTSNLGGALPLVARGKVRDLYDINDKTLLFVATDRISAFDVTMENGIPEKGKLLTLLTAHWFQALSAAMPGLRTHFITLNLPPQVPRALAPQFQDRSMQVRKLKVFPIEAIVRGYITGSAWSSYRKTGLVNGIQMPPNLLESQAFPEPIYTPSTKSPAGEKDENISTSEAASIVGQKYASHIEELALKLYKTARDYASERGLIIADTKFEFALDEDNDEVVLVDEVLTPDSSRFWDKATYEVGRPQESFDKQFLRDWLIETGKKGQEGVSVPDEIVQRTVDKYREAYNRLVGTKWKGV